jgi:hypothetical protein
MIPPHCPPRNLNFPHCPHGIFEIIHRSLMLIITETLPSFWLTDVNHFLCVSEAFNIPQPPSQQMSMSSGQQFLNCHFTFFFMGHSYTQHVLKSCFTLNVSLSSYSLMSWSSLSISSLIFVGGPCLDHDFGLQ